MVSMAFIVIHYYGYPSYVYRPYGNYDWGNGYNRGLVVMAGTDMAEDTVGEAMDGVVDMVTTDNDISKTGSYEIS